LVLGLRAEEAEAVKAEAVEDVDLKFAVDEPRISLFFPFG